jgi:hypothetical protein
VKLKILPVCGRWSWDHCLAEAAYFQWIKAHSFITVLSFYFLIVKWLRTRMHGSPASNRHDLASEKIGGGDDFWSASCGIGELNGVAASAVGIGEADEFAGVWPAS